MPINNPPAALSSLSTPLLETEALSIVYDQAERAVDGLNLRVHSGEILGIVGESGSGKSTLLRALINLLGAGATIEQGQIRFAGEDTRSWSAKRWRQARGGEMAMIFQDPGASLSPMMTVERQFVEAIRNHRALGKKQARAVALEAIARLQLKEPQSILRSRCWQLSGGMKQRVAIAMSLALNPRLILADEPTSALDVTSQVRVLQALKAQRDQFGSAVLLVSHNLGACAAIADKLLVMKDGRVVDFGTVADISQRGEDTYAGQLLRAVPHLKEI